MSNLRFKVGDEVLDCFPAQKGVGDEKEHRVRIVDLHGKCNFAHLKLCDKIKYGTYLCGLKCDKVVWIVSTTGYNPYPTCDIHLKKIEPIYIKLTTRKFRS